MLFIQLQPRVEPVEGAPWHQAQIIRLLQDDPHALSMEYGVNQIVRAWYGPEGAGSEWGSDGADVTRQVKDRISVAQPVRAADFGSFLEGVFKAHNHVLLVQVSSSGSGPSPGAAAAPRADLSIYPPWTVQQRDYNLLVAAGGEVALAAQQVVGRPVLPGTPIEELDEYGNPRSRVTTPDSLFMGAAGLGVGMVG